MSEPKRVMNGRNVATAVFLLLSNFLVITAVWLAVRFGTVDMTTILFHLKVPIGGADATNFYEIFILLFTIGPAATALELGIFALIARWSRSRKQKDRKATISTWITEHRRMIAVILMVVAICFVGYQLHIVKYVVNQFRNSPIYDDEYVDPRKVAITAPEQKRNLVFIYMESMEVSYADAEHGGASKENLIPEMADIAVANVSFSDTSVKLNGAQPVIGTTWTMGSLVAQTAGVPLTIPLGDNAMGRKAFKTFLPGVYTIGQVLRDNGYELLYLIGSDKKFAGADIYMTTHGDYTIKDLDYYRAIGELDADYHVWWGFEDEKVYDFARKEILNLAAGDKPFAITFMTMDTHYTNGYRCPLCEDRYPEQYSNVIACASRQLDHFLQWMSIQPFFDNTTIIVVGDHPTMDTKYADNLPYNTKDYKRKTYCVVINPAVQYFPTKEMREFTALDMYPTTLAAMGFTIPGNRLGLGVNLFSEERTLLEKYGMDELNDLLEMHSKFYDELMYGTEEE